MKLLTFPHDVKYGSIFEMGYDGWWKIDNSGQRSIPQNPEFQFEIGKLIQEKSNLSLGGYLINTSLELFEIPIFPSPAVFVLTIYESESIKYNRNRPMRPLVPPPPHVLIAPNSSKIAFRASLDLNSYVYDDKSTVEVFWYFMTWNEPRKHGQLQIDLDLYEI